MSERLTVYFAGQIVGTLWSTESGQMQFQYSESWREARRAFPISVSLPLEGNYLLNASHFFFANLLPEATVRQRICQALGISPVTKYEKEGGPSLKQCAELIRRHTALPLLDLQRLLQWTLFNLLVGNADAHGKNLSLLYDTTGTPSLAPFYDLVCTRNSRRISRETAMSIGGTTDPDLVGLKQWERLAAELGLRPRVVVGELETLMDKLIEGLPVVTERFATQFGASPVLERLPIVIRKIVRRVRGQLYS